MDLTCIFKTIRAATFLLLLSPVLAFAQGSEQLTGTVTDVNGNPILGATVFLQSGGEKRGTSTDNNGNFYFPDDVSIGNSATLTVSYIGCKPFTKVIGKERNFEISMKDSSVALDEVVAIGYATQKKVNLTGAVGQISAKEIEDRPVTNIGGALQGRLPNLNITFPGGRPDQGATYNIRGNTSPNGGSPLILIDGVEGEPERLNPSDIESVSVLKDAASAAIYGARASFGVILISTKNGKRNQKPQITYDGYYAFSKPTTKTDFETRGYDSAYVMDLFSNAADGKPYTTYTEEDYQELLARRNDKVEVPERPWVKEITRNGRQQYLYLANFDWYNYMFDDSRPTWRHNLNIQGGSDKVSYYISGGYYSQEGVNKVRPDKFKNYNLRVKLDADLFSWLRVYTNTKYYRQQYNFYGFNSDYHNFRKPTLHAIATMVPRNPDGTAVSHSNVYSSSTSFLMDGYNAMLLDGNSKGENLTHEFTTQLGVEFKIEDFLKVNADFNYVFGALRNNYRSTEVEYSQYPGIMTKEATSTFPNAYSETVWDQNYYTANVYATYSDVFKNNHSVDAIVGFNYETRHNKDLIATRDGLQSNELSDFNLAAGETIELTGGQKEYAIMGWFFRGMYNYKSRYFIEIDGRYDGSSRFPRHHRWGFFPSASAAYRISEEQFFRKIRPVVNNLKLRLSYGQLGNQQIGEYDYMQTISSGAMSAYTFDGVSAGMHSWVSAPVASDFTWERVTSKNIGIDWGFLNNRLSASADFYIRDTKGILTEGMKLPPLYGADEPLINANDMQTKGYEISLSWNDSFILGNKPFYYSLGGSLSDYVAEYTKADNPNGIISQPYVGQKFGAIWGFRTGGLFKTTEEAQSYAKEVNLTQVNKDALNAKGDKGLQAGDLKYLDLNHDGKVNRGANTLADPGDQEIIGNSQPRYSYSFTGSASWNGIDLSIFFQGIGHMDWYPGADNQRFWGPYSRPYASFVPRDYIERFVWTEENPDTYLPRPRGYAAQKSGGSLYWTNDRYLQNLAYCRLKNLTIGYTLPEKWTKKVHVEKLRIYFSGDNLITWSPLKSDYVDPEQTAGTSDKKGNNYPFSKTFSFGINLTL